MKIPQKPINESERLAALYEYEILDTPYEDIFDAVTKLAASICNVPISVINIIDKNRQWSKSSFGIKNVESPRDFSFCAHTLLEIDIMEVSNALDDERFFDNPLVLEEPKIRFYAGMPLINPDGYALGSLCVIDQKERKLTSDQKENLKQLSKIIISVFELKKAIKNDIR
jgi:GAF domain-containing protein